MCEVVQTAKQDALEMLVTLFDWLDSLEPQPLTETIPLDPKSHTLEAKKPAVSIIPCLHLVLESYPHWEQGVNAVSNTRKIASAPGWKLTPDRYLRAVPRFLKQAVEKIKRVFTCE